MRKLASIQVIHELIPIKEADRIELAKIMGWQCAVSKGSFQVGDIGVYFEVDSFLPIEEKYEFLRNSSYVNNEFMGEGFRIRTKKMRGIISQGLFLPLSAFPHNLNNLEIGTDLTERLNIVKWDIPEVVGNAGTMIGNKPYGIPTTDEKRVQSNKIVLDLLKGHPYYITTKIDGTSSTYYYMNGEYGACGRNYEYKNDNTSAIWEFGLKNDIFDKLKKLGLNIALQGEFAGPNIQKNKLALKDYDYYLFDVYDLDNLTYYELEDLKTIADKIGVKTVPIEEVGQDFQYTQKDLLEKAKGIYDSKQPKEGIVIRSLINNKDFNSKNNLNNRISFKVINNEFLLKEK